MDSITRQVLVLIDELCTNKSCAVTKHLINPFYQACRDKHIAVNGGAFTLDPYGRVCAQCFYID